MRITPLLLTACCLPSLSHAELQFNGFLSAIGGMATEQLEDQDGNKSNVRGYEDTVTFNEDTLFGLQARAAISDKLTMTGQLVSRGSEEFATELAWGYVAYDINDKLTARMGRFRTPFYTYSDFLEVGYAYHWISPPSEVYAIPFNNINGIDVLYNAALTEDLGLEIQFYGGAQDEDLVLRDTGQTLDTNTREHMGLVATLNYFDFSFRASIHNASLSVSNLEEITGPLIAGFSAQAANPAYPEALRNNIQQVVNGLSEELVIDGVSTTFSQAGLKYDGARVFAVAEYTALDYESGPQGDQERYYFNIGANFGNTSIYVGYAKADDENIDLSESYQIAQPDLNNELAYQLKYINQTLTVHEETRTVGLRYAFEAGAAFKIQYDSISSLEGVSRTNLNPTEDEDQGILRFGVDLVF